MTSAGYARNWRPIRPVSSSDRASARFPSGVAEPSRADTRLTERLRDALGLVDIRVLDHLIVGDGEPVSFAERGRL